MINILMNQKRGLNRFSKLPDDGDTWAPNNQDQAEIQHKQYHNE